MVNSVGLKLQHNRLSTIFQLSEFPGTALNIWILQYQATTCHWNSELILFNLQTNKRFTSENSHQDKRRETLTKMRKSASCYTHAVYLENASFLSDLNPLLTTNSASFFKDFLFVPSYLSSCDRATNHVQIFPVHLQIELVQFALDFCTES